MGKKYGNRADHGNSLAVGTYAKRLETVIQTWGQFMNCPYIWLFLGVRP